MAPRKDTMRIIRQDAGFSAKLGFGGPTTTLAEEGNIEAQPVVLARQAAQANPPPTLPMGRSVSAESAVIDVAAASLPESHGRSREVHGGSEAIGYGTTSTMGDAPSGTCSARGHVVYIAVSLTATQATLAERWASAAKCSVQFLIRRVAQGLREEVFDEWALNGMPDVDEPRGMRGRHPTSVTMTLRPQFAAELSEKHDPLMVLGLARIMGPAFRARFQVAFDHALEKAGIASATGGGKE